MKSFFLSKKGPMRGLVFESPVFYNKGNPNNCLVSIDYDYGMSNVRYTKSISFMLFPINQPSTVGRSKYNGHARTWVGCRLFYISFDWNCKIS